MEITFEDDSRTLTHVITLKVPMSELVHANLTRWDLLLIRDSTRSNSIADKLLALETIARRIEESKHD